MGLIKKIFILIIIVTVIWLGIGIYLILSNKLPDASNYDLLFKSPKHLFDIIKAWTVSV